MVTHPCFDDPNSTHTTETVALADALTLGPALWPTVDGPGAVFMDHPWWQTVWDVAPVSMQRAAKAILVRVGQQIRTVVPVSHRFERGIPVLTWADNDLGCPDFRSLGPRAVAPDIALALSEASPTRIRLDSMAAHDRTNAGVAGLLRGLGWRVTFAPQHSAPSIELPGSWAAYLETFSGKSRQTLRRKLRKAERSGALRVIDHHDDGSISLGFDRLVDLHERRWRGRGVFSDPIVRRFHGLLTRRLSRRGELRLTSLEIDGRPMAAYYGFSSGGTASFYQSGRDPDADGSVGTLLLAHAIQRAIADGATRFDLLRGDESYKSRWKPEETTTWCLEATAPGVAGRLTTLADASIAWASRLRRRD